MLNKDRANERVVIVCASGHRRHAVCSFLANNIASTQVASVHDSGPSVLHRQHGQRTQVVNKTNTLRKGVHAAPAAGPQGLIYPVPLRWIRSGKKNHRPPAMGTYLQRASNLSSSCVSSLCSSAAGLLASLPRAMLSAGCRCRPARS